MTTLSLPQDILDALIEAASIAQENAYAPYSLFSVGSAVLTDDDEIFSGCNVENASYPVGSCAEQNAIGAMIAGGGSAIKAVVIVGPKDVPLTPCGACRQRIREFSTDETVVICMGKTGTIIQHTLTSLLPESFGPDSVNLHPRSDND